MSFLISRSRAARQGFGKPVPRKEDARLVAGRGRYSDDFSLPGQAQAQLVRSPHAHARVLRIDVTAALAVSGVIAVLTGKDAETDGLGPIPHKPVPTNPNEFPLGGREGSSIFIAPHPVLATDAARFVGEPVAMVIAETAAAAADGAERVVVDYEPLPSVTATRDAAETTAPVLWKEAGSNVCVDSVAGDARAAEAAFARAAHVVRLDTWVPRITGVPMEPRAALGVYDEATGRYTLFAGSGGVVRHKNDLAEILGVPDTAVRVVAQDVGGNFGTRNSFYPEFALVAWAARRLGRPVKWTCTRREAFRRHIRAAQQGTGAVHQCLSRAGGRRARARGAQQYVATRSLSERGPAPGHVRHGATYRPGRSPSRFRPRGVATTQPRAARRDAVHQSLRHRL